MPSAYNFHRLASTIISTSTLIGIAPCFLNFAPPHPAACREEEGCRVNEISIC